MFHRVLPFRVAATTAATLVTAVLMLLVLASSATAQDVSRPLTAATLPSCDDNGTRYTASTDQTSFGVLMHQGLSFCLSGEEASVSIVQDPPSPHAVVPLEEWSYMVSINDDTPATFTLNAMCGTTIVCQSTVTYAVPTPPPSSSSASSSTSSSGSSSPPPPPAYPSCTHASTTRIYPAGTTSVDVFPMDVQDGRCAYATSISAWPSVGLLIPDSHGLGYVYLIPSGAEPGTIADVHYTVLCNNVVTCAGEVRMAIAAAQTMEYPPCSHASKTRSYPVGTTSKDTFPMDMLDGNCAYTTDISVGPSIGTITPASSGLSYTFAVPSTAARGFQTSLGYRVRCSGVTVCEDIVSVVLAPASDPTEAPTPPPSSLPSCSHSSSTSTYRIGELYVRKLPLDVVDAECAYTAVIQDPSVGTAAVTEPSDPMSYVYATSADVAPQDTSILYTIACNGVDICKGAVGIHLTLDAPACPNNLVSYIIKPGDVMQGAVDSGMMCSSGASPTATIPSTVPGLSLSSNGSFTFEAPMSEADVLATVVMECNGEVTCQAKMVFVVASATVAPPPTTTTSTAAPIAACPKSFTYDVPVGQSISGTINPVPTSTCDITTYLVDNSTADVGGRLRVNLLGAFYYAAPNSQRVDYAAVDVFCAKAFVCRTQLAFTAYIPLPTAYPTTSPLPPCANVYYYDAVPGVAIKASLNDMPGQDLCAHGRYFTLNAAPQGGNIEITPIGDFLYRPPLQEGQFSFSFTMYCLNQMYCSGTAYLLVSNEWTLGPMPTTSPTGENQPALIVNEQITCRGTCNAHAWKTYPSVKMWDNSPGAGYTRKDGRPVDGMTVTWRNNSLVFYVYSLIGNLGVRFPTFEPVVTTRRAYMEPVDFAGSVADGSPGFEMRCLAYQGRTGMGEDVWKWNSLSMASGNGSVGAFYNSGASWYQKFGGKHENCDVFVDPCHYAPLLTPANYTNTSLGRWTIDINDCDATWLGVFPYQSIENMRKYDGSPVWTFVDDRQLQGTLYSEAVQASSWLEPGQFDAHYDTHDILIKLKQFVSVTKPGTRDSIISVDAEFFTYTDSTTHDLAFGINMLVYPYVDASMTTNYVRDRHVKGFKWVEQEWQSPSTKQCPTCTGSKMACTSAVEGLLAYTSATFPEGDCSGGRGRVHLSKGPAMMTGECPENAMHVFNQSGFSATRNCKTTYQNITLRGIVPGSHGLNTSLSRAFNYEGDVALMLLMDDDSYERLNLHLSMYVTRLSKDARRVEGGLSTCRSGSYWPVLDPLGTSLTSHPFELSVATATPMCIDDLSSSYGPSDWALFALNMPGVAPAEVTVYSVFLLHNHRRVYLIYKDPNTGVSAIPDSANGDWWQYTYPFFSFRDLTALVANSSIEYSPQMEGTTTAEDVVYAFTFIPGSFGVDTDIEVVVEAAIQQQSGSAPSMMEFRQVLHVDPLLTQLSRQGPPVYDNVSHHTTDKSDLYAIGALAGVAVALVITVIFFMLADSNRPLPRWVPRGKLVKETVLSMLPAGLRGKKKPKRVVHKDMYDAMNSGRY